MSTNTTTYFFREARTLATLVGTLPRASAHVWIVGCSSGDEPYTLGILAAEAGVNLEITASDVNPRALRAARSGRYNAHHIRHVPEALKERYFAPHGDGFEVRTDLLPPVRFVEHNIARDGALKPEGASWWNAVLCRHVLVYLDIAASQHALAVMTTHLDENAPLVLAGSEWLGVGTRLGTLAAHAKLDLQPLAADGDAVCYRKHARHIISEPPVVRVKPAARPVAVTPASDRPLERIELALREGEAALDRGDLEHAQARFEECITLAGNSAEAHLRYGITCMVAGEPKRARRALERVIALRGESWPALLLLGDLEASTAPMAATLLYRRALAALRLQFDPPPELARLDTLWPNRTTLIDMLQRRLDAT